MIFVGVDWAEETNEVWILDETGVVTLDRGSVSNDLAGVESFHERCGGLVDEAGEVVVGIETDQGLFVTALVGAGYQVYGVNPLAADRYRDRHHISGAKSDTADAKMLADLVRTDRHNHRQVASDSTLAKSIKVLARAHQGLIWSRTRTTSQLRATLRSFYPAALEAFDDLDHPDAVGVLGAAPTPTQARKLSKPQIKAALRRGGRQRYFDRRTDEIGPILRAQELAAPDRLEAANGEIVRALVNVIAVYNRQIDELASQLESYLGQHPDAEILQSLPGLGIVLGVRVLGEFGDDPTRYETAKARKNAAGTSPITITSGKRRVVQARYATNDRLLDAAMQWAFCSLSRSPGARSLYDTKYAVHEDHNKALRPLANRLIGILHGCLKTRTLYNEKIAWPTVEKEEKNQKAA